MKRRGFFRFGKEEEHRSTGSTKLPNEQKPRWSNLNWFSKIYFCWVWKILNKGRKENLEECDIPPVPKPNSCSIVGEKLIVAWKGEQQKKSPRLWRLMLRVYWKEIATQGIMFLFSQVLQIWRSILLGFFLDAYALSPNWILTRILAVGLILTSAINVLTVNPWNFLGSELGMNMSSALTALLYHKSLKLTAKGLSQTDQGKLANLVSNDVKRLETRIGVLHALWVGPLVTLATFFTLWFYFDPASAAGLLVLTLVVTISSIVSIKSSRILVLIAAFRDTRLKLIDEITTNIRQIKVYCWEKIFENKVNEIRSDEVNSLLTRWNFWAIYRNLYITAPRLVVFVALFSTLANNGALNPGTAFVIMTLYNTVTSLMSHGFPSAFFLIKELSVSLKRCHAFLLLDEWSSSPFELRKAPLRTRTGKVTFKDYTGKRPNKKNNVLRKVSLEVKAGEPLILLGGVGSGKTTLFAAILGEVEGVSGSVEIQGGIALVSQNSWTFPATLRENVVFGSPFIPHWYNRVLDACALTEDVRLFPRQDMEVVGDKGMTLSGGQKARINLARALYADKEIYLIDNVLGAVDAVVGAHILKNVIFGLLKSKCVLMVTSPSNGLFGQSCVFIKNGEIVEMEKYENLRRDMPDLFQAVRYQKFQMEHFDQILEPHKPAKQEQFFGEILEEKSCTGEQNKPLEEVVDGVTVLINCVNAAKQGRWGIISLLTLILCQLLQSATDVMLTKWLNDSYKLGIDKIWHSTMVYMVLLALNFAVGLAGLCLFYKVCTKSGAKLHSKAVRGLIEAKLRIFSKTTTGSILNGFSMDMSSVDEYLPKAVEAAFFSLLQVTGILGVVIGLNEILAIPAFTVAFLFFRLRSYYIRPAYYLRRQEAIARGPVYALVNTTFDGLSTIRSLGRKKYFMQKFYCLKDEHTAACFAFLAAFNWFIFWTDLLVLLFTILAVIASLEFTKDTAVAGLTLSLIFSADNTFSYGLQQTAELGNEVVSVERMEEYSNLESEFKNETNIDAERCFENGGGVAIEFKNVDAEYVTNSLVLRQLNCTIFDGEKVGIVGRTGSGKTSFLGCILRLLDISKGKVFVEGMDVNELQLHRLRSQVSVISQTPTFVEGSLRYNLDVESKFSDNELWNVVAAVQMEKRIKLSGLEMIITTGGSNFSHGERQLLSLARAMLQNNNILLIDELTANIDAETESVIQDVIKTRFRHCTIVAVAHSLNALFASDTICVMDRGEIKEWDSPQSLLQNRNSMLSKLVEQWLGDAQLNGNYS